MENKDALVRKLNALRAKANDPSIKGSPEAIALMAKYVELMQKHNITEEELKDNKPGSKIGADFRKHDHNPTCLGHLAVMIAKLTDTRVKSNSNAVVYAGLVSDVQHATFLFDVVSTAFENGKKAYRNSPEFAKLIDDQIYDGVMKFEMGMTVIIHAAIEKMIQEKETNNPGNSLIVLKNALIAQELGNDNTGETSTDIVPKADDRALHSGMREGEKVILRKQTESVVKGYLK